MSRAIREGAVLAGLSELARFRTRLGAAERDHLTRLVASWGLLADLSFSDLLLFTPVHVDDGVRYLVASHVRPTTSQTIYREDRVGILVDAAERPLVDLTYRSGRRNDGQVRNERLGDEVKVKAVPVRHRGRVISVVSSEYSPSIRRLHGELEKAYRGVYDRFARMIAAGEFPFAHGEVTAEDAPRVGDGVIVLDEEARASYLSPNAVSALHRAGVHVSVIGQPLSEVGFEQGVVSRAFATGQPCSEELERGADVAVLARCIPLLDDGAVTGGVVLLRDISELRHRDRLLVSKDATIREIHHRVKNNLQTISSLLRLQGRRLDEPTAKAAIEESVRRIASIALVHETLSREPGEDVPFIEILRPLMRMVEEGLVNPEHPVTFSIEGDPGRLPATTATALAVVLTELLQNAVDHAFPADLDPAPDGNRLEVALRNDGGELTLAVTDNGCGLPADFCLDEVGLGLSIVRTLVRTELNGTIRVEPAGLPAERDQVAGGTWDRGAARPGTTVELRVPSGMS